MTLAASNNQQASTALMTAEEFLRLGDDFHGELRRGKIITMSPAGSQHGAVAMAIGARIKIFVDDHGLGSVYAAETGFIISHDPDTVRAPDVSFVAAARIPEGGNGPGFFDGAPDLAVEVLSPSNTPAETAEKVDEYLKAGVRLIWVVDPSRKTVTAYTSAEKDFAVVNVGDTLNGVDVLPGFTLEVGMIFR